MSQRPVAEYSGSCHCGAIGYAYNCNIPPSGWAIRACQCRFCRSHDALSASDPAARITFTATEVEQLQCYRFGLNTADFLICRRCGVYIGAMIETAKGRFGIVNAHALIDPPPEIAGPQPVHYDGEKTDDRILRREERWSPVVDIPK